MSKAQTLATIVSTGNVLADGTVAYSEVSGTPVIGVDVQAYDATLLNDADIGVAVQAYDATLLNDADIGVAVQAYDATLLNDADIGVTVQGYDATLLNDADIGVTVQGYDATIVVDADIGSSVQAYDGKLTDIAGITPTIATALVGNGSTFIASTSSTDAIQMPVGTDEERPAAPSNGMVRYSSTSGSFEGYQAGAWAAIGGGGDVGAPTLSGSSSGNEFSNTTVTITDYDASLIYRVSVTGGSYTRAGGTITWTLPGVAADTIHYMTVNAIDNGVTSPDADWDIDVLNVAFSGDTGIQVTNFANNSSNTGWLV